MIVRKAPRLAHRPLAPELSLALATAIALAVVGACSWVAGALSLDRTQLGGFVFVAGVYWALSILGYATRVRARRQERRGRSNAALGVRRATLRGHRGTTRALTGRGGRSMTETKIR